MNPDSIIAFSRIALSTSQDARMSRALCNKKLIHGF